MTDCCLEPEIVAPRFHGFGMWHYGVRARKFFPAYEFAKYYIGEYKRDARDGYGKMVESRRGGANLAREGKWEEGIFLDELDPNGFLK